MYIIAEIGVNFFDIAKKYDISLFDACKLMIVDAKKNGAHAVKFQAYKADTLASKHSPAYWDTTLEPTTNQHELFKKHDCFEQKDFENIATFCNKTNIDFICTPFDLASVDYLDNIVDVYKISSSDITNKPLLIRVAEKKKKIFLSTGASTIEEIKQAIDIIQSTGNNDIVIMHCVLSYPTKDEDANLHMITSIKNNFPEYEIGYSDHTKPDTQMMIVTAAYLLGATYIEKHYTLDKTLQGNDHYHSMDSCDLKQLTNTNKFLNVIIGKKEKEVLLCEQQSRLHARRSIVAKKNIKKGQIIQSTDLICKRPGTGISPIDIDKLIDKTAVTNVKEDEIIQWNHIQ
tara:strand:+ start:2628 stop:3659 length:1032 start_codon:yes stop_codon:yes gene_type:complete